MRRWLAVGFACVAAVLSSTAAVGIGADEPPRADVPQGTDDSLLHDSPARRLLERRAGAASDAALEARRSRGSAEERQERQDSRRKYADLSDVGARDVLRSAYANSLVAPAHRPLADSRLIRADGLRTGVIEKDGKHFVVDSTTPIFSRTPGGSLVPVDLRLERRQGRFEPVAGSLPVELGATLDDGISLAPDAPTLEFEGHPDAAAEPLGGGLVYPNVREDTDLIVRVLPSGVETFDILRSAGSPQQWDVSLSGPGGSLEEAGRGSFRVVRDGDVVGRFGAPAATDADGVQVDVEAALVDERTLRLSVRHREHDVRYPVAVDPVYEWYSWQNGSTNYDNWQFSAANWTFRGFTGPGWNGNGLYVHSNGGTNFYWHNQSGYWTYWPLAGTSIANWGVAFMDHRILRNDAGAVCQFAGLMRTSDNQWHQSYTNCGSYFGASVYHSNSQGTATKFMTGSYHGGDAWRDFVTKAGHVELQLTDPGPPSVTPHAPPVSWTKNPSVSASTYDLGFGVREVRLNGAAKYSRNCNGTHTGGLCQRDPLVSATVNDGITTLNWDAADGAGARASASSAPKIRVDRQPPTLQITGDLRTLTADLDGRDLFDIRVEASDGNPSGPESARRSGVKSLRLLVGGVEQPLEIAPRTCGPDSCAMVGSYELDTDDLAEGPHTVRVETRDYLDHLAFTEWTINVPRDNVYAGEVASWRTSVQQQVDEALPAVPLSAPMPTPPDAWTRENECRASEAALRACFETNGTWGQDVRDWLQENGGPAINADSLPEYPVFRYAQAPEFQPDFTAATAGAWDVAKRAGTSAAAILTVDLSLAEPVSPADVTSLSTTLGFNSVEIVRGVYDPAGAAITAETEHPAGTLLSAQIETFYESHRANAVAVREDLAAMEGNVLDADELADIQQAVSDADAAAASLAARDPFVTALRIQALPTDLLDALVDADVPVKSMIVVPDATDVTPADFEPLPTNSETIQFTAPPSAGATTGGSSRSASTTATASRRRGQTCADRHETQRPHGVSSTFLPSRWEMKVALTGGPDDDGLYVKRNSLFFRWYTDRSLSYFCSDKAGDRGFEPETKPFASGNRWSTNWDGNSEFFTRLPRPYKDDLACGPGCITDGEGDTGVYTPPRYPDFAIGTAYGRYLRYGDVYWSIFRTNRGERNDGTAVIRGQQVTRPYARFHGVYCKSRSIPAKGNDDKYCMFKRTTRCVEHIPLRTQSPVHRRIDWRSAGNANRCDVQPNP